MEIAYCPECGEQICGEEKKFCFSFAGIFDDEDGILKYDIADSVDFSAFVNRDSGKLENPAVVTLFRDNGFTDTANLLQSNSLDRSLYEKVMGVTTVAKLSGNMDIDFNANQVNIIESDFLKLVFATELYNQLRNAFVNGNRILNYLLSKELDYYNDDTNSNIIGELDLVQLLAVNSGEKFDNLRNKLNSFLTPEELALFEKHIDEFTSIKRVLWLFKKKSWSVKFSSKFSVRHEGEYLTSIFYNGKNCSKRICPNCGTHISKYLGIYKQKIISFIGTPTSGKSTFINAIYYKLMRSSHKINGAIGTLDQYDPYYSEYVNNARRMEQKFTVKKTAKGTFPVLYLLVNTEHGENEEKKGIYTFVDVPGEYFSSGGNAIAAKGDNLRRMGIMAHSDVMCPVVAIEQLLGYSPFKDADAATLAEIEGDALAYYSNVCQQLYDGLLKNNRSCDVVLLISKSDAIPIVNDGEPGTDDMILRDGAEGRIRTNVNLNTYYTLKAMRRDSDNVYYNENTNVIDDAKLNEYCEFSSKMMSINNNRWQGDITNIFSNLVGRTNINTQDIRVFFLSSYGFYAINDISALPKEKKIKALTQIEKIGDDKGKAEKILKIFNSNSLASFGSGFADDISMKVNHVQPSGMFLDISLKSDTSKKRPELKLSMMDDKKTGKSGSDMNSTNNSSSQKEDTVVPASAKKSGRGRRSSAIPSRADVSGNRTTPVPPARNNSSVQKTYDEDDDSVLFFPVRPLNINTGNSENTADTSKFNDAHPVAPVQSPVRPVAQNSAYMPASAPAKDNEGDFFKNIQDSYSRRASQPIPQPSRQPVPQPSRQPVPQQQTPLREEDQKKALIQRKNEELDKICSGLTVDDVKNRFINYYKSEHMMHNPEGINILLYYIFEKTRLILSQDDIRELNRLENQLSEARRNLGRLKESLRTTLFRRANINHDITTTENHIRDLEERIKSYKF